MDLWGKERKGREMRRGGVERGAEVKGDMRGRKGGNAKEKQELGKGEIAAILISKSAPMVSGEERGQMSDRPASRTVIGRRSYTRDIYDAM